MYLYNVVFQIKVILQICFKETIDMKELVDFVVLIIIYFWKFYKKWKEKGRDVLFVNTLMYIYLSFVLFLP